MLYSNVLKTLVTCLFLGLIGGCIEGDHDETSSESAIPEYALTEKPYTALQQVWAPREPSPEVRAMMNDGRLTVYQPTQWPLDELGVRLEAGIPWIEHLELAPGFPGEGAQRKSLAYIWVAADPQVIDEESPIRMDGWDKLYRPQGRLTPQVFEAHVRTARRISDLSNRPFDFTILPGDLTDTSQRNELDWVITALNGGVIDPDSGVDDDPIPGPGNDYNDPFLSVGIDTPWYPALGNHDVLHLGIFGLIDDDLRAGAVSDRLFTDNLFSGIWGGYEAGDTVDHEVILSEDVITPSDARRLPLNKTELLQTYYEAAGEPAGHGFSSRDVKNKKGYYSVSPIPGKPIRLIVLDSTDASLDTFGISLMGSMDSEQFSWLREELLAAANDFELIILVSHHRLEDFHDQSEVPAETIKSLLASSENVILHLAGHRHRNSKTLQTINDSNGYWQLMSASSIDFPFQSRVMELVYEGNGYLSIYVTNFGNNAEEMTLADNARQLAGGKLAFGSPGFDGDTVAAWEADTQAQNLLLRVALPNDIRSNLEQVSDWPDIVESVHTLADF